jgi:flagellar biosynthesis GTPase FlhF
MPAPPRTRARTAQSVAGSAPAAGAAAKNDEVSPRRHEEHGVARTQLAVLGAAAVASLLLWALGVLWEAAIASLLLVGAEIANVLRRRLQAGKTRAGEGRDFSGCWQGTGASELRQDLVSVRAFAPLVLVMMSAWSTLRSLLARLPGSRPKGAHPRWVGGSWSSLSGVLRRLSVHGVAPSGDLATARATWGLGRLAHGLWSAARCTLALVCSAIAAGANHVAVAPAAMARLARRSAGRGLRACAIKQAARAATAGPAVKGAEDRAATPAVTKPPDATKSKDGDLAANLAARRQWEDGVVSASSAQTAPAKATPSPPAKSPPAASAPGAVPPSDDLAAKLASRRQWEGGNGSAPAPAPALAVKTPAVSGARLPKIAPGCVPPADDLAAKFAKRRNLESVSEDGVSRDQQAIQAAEKEQQEREERVLKLAESKAAGEAKDAQASNAKAAAELEYKRKIAEDLAKQKAKEAAEHAEQAAREVEAERALAVAEQNAATKLAEQQTAAKEREQQQQNEKAQTHSNAGASGLRKTGLLAPGAEPPAAPTAASESPVEAKSSSSAEGTWRTVPNKEAREGEKEGERQKQMLSSSASSPHDRSWQCAHCVPRALAFCTNRPIVIDNGTGRIKAGFADDQAPKVPLFRARAVAQQGFTSFNLSRSHPEAMD